MGKDGEPAMPGMLTADVRASMQGLAPVLMALPRRERQFPAAPLALMVTAHFSTSLPTKRCR